MSNNRTFLLYYAVQNKISLRFLEDGKVELDGLIYPSIDHALGFCHRVQLKLPSGGGREELLPHIDPPGDFCVSVADVDVCKLPDEEGVAIICWPDPSGLAEALVITAEGTVRVYILGLPRSFASMIDDGQYKATWRNGMIRVDF